MWGRAEAVELQVLQLLELRSLVARQADPKDNFSALQDAYHRFLSSTVDGPHLLSAAVDDVDQLVKRMAPFVVGWQPAVSADEVFVSHDIVLRLRLKPGLKLPTTSLIATYYETFKRTIRGIARPGATGTKKEMAEATEFLAPDMDVRRANGVPGAVVLPMKIPSNTQFSLAELWNAVDTAIRALADMSQWAASGDGPDVLVKLIGDPVRRQKVAFHALRLIPTPSSPCDQVELGGQVIHGGRPVTLNVAMAARLKDALSVGQVPPTEVTVAGVVRSLDLDAGTIGVKSDDDSKRLVFSLPPDLFEAPESLGGRRVNVVGDEYRRPSGKPFRLVREIAVENGDDEDDVREE
jgi:hypothetical protein